MTWAQPIRNTFVGYGSRNQTEAPNCQGQRLYAGGSWALPGIVLRSDQIDRLIPSDKKKKLIEHLLYFRQAVQEPCPRGVYSTFEEIGFNQKSHKLMSCCSRNKCSEEENNRVNRCFKLGIAGPMGRQQRLTEKVTLAETMLHGPKKVTFPSLSCIEVDPHD